jgi:hypothetical protein
MLPKQELRQGESFTHYMTTSTETMGTVTEMTMKMKQDVVKVEGNEITLRLDMNIKMSSQPEMPKGMEEMRIVTVTHQTKDGKLISSEVEKVEPAFLENLIKQSTENQLTYQTSQQPIENPQKFYPEGGVALGDKWEIPVEEAGNKGKMIAELAKIEKIEVGAGTFECFRLDIDMDITTLTPMTEEESMETATKGKTYVWLDRETGIPIASQMDLDITTRMGETQISTPIKTSLQLVEYSSPA